MTHRLAIWDWHPVTLNELIGRHFGTISRKKRADRDLVMAYAHIYNIPLAAERRRVDISWILAPDDRQHDEDNCWKSILDSLVHAGLLIDDDQEHCERGAVRFERGTRKATIIELTDLDPFERAQP